MCVRVLKVDNMRANKISKLSQVVKIFIVCDHIVNTLNKLNVHTQRSNNKLQKLRIKLNNLVNNGFKVG